MNRNEFEQKLGVFLDGLASTVELPETDAPCPRDDDDPVVHELVRSFLMDGAPRAGVGPALERLRASVVDYNELRVGLAEESAAALPSRYPSAFERCKRIRAALHEVFRRENGMNLAHLRDEPKRSARAYLDSLPGITPFVAARVALLSCESHAFPLDPVLLGVLERAGVVEPGLGLQTVSGRLERAIRAGEARGHYRRLEQHAMNAGAPAGRVRKSKPPRSRGARAAGKS